MCDSDTGMYTSQEKPVRGTWNTHMQFIIINKVRIYVRSLRRVRKRCERRKKRYATFSILANLLYSHIACLTTHWHVATSASIGLLGVKVRSLCLCLCVTGSWSLEAKCCVHFKRTNINRNDHWWGKTRSVKRTKGRNVAVNCMPNTWHSVGSLCKELLYMKALCDQPVHWGWHDVYFPFRRRSIVDDHITPHYEFRTVYVTWSSIIQHRFPGYESLPSPAGKSFSSSVSNGLIVGCL